MAKAAALTATLLTLSGAFGTKTADAHMLKRHHGETMLHFSNRVIHHAETGIFFIRHNASRYRLYPRYRRALRNHRWLLRYGRELHSRYAPRIVYMPPHYSAWLCIHRYEGSWTDPNPPYFGGLQMDYSFMSSYGGALLRTKGTADHWTPTEQMWVAENALNAGRGFYPWPNTARMCGLI